MKKNAPNARSNSRARSASSRAPQIATKRTTPTKKSSSSKKKSSGKTVGIVLACIVVLLVLVAGGYIFKTGGVKKLFVEKLNVVLADGTTTEMTAEEIKTELSGDVFFQGIKIDGIDVSGKTKEEAYSLISASLTSKPSEVDIKLNYDGQEFPLDLSSLALESNAQEIVNEAFSYGRPSTEATNEELVDCFNKYQNLKVTPKEYMTAYTVKTDGISEIVTGILEPFNKDVVEARVESFDKDSLVFLVSDSEDGRVVDIDKAIADVKALLDSRTYEGVVEVEFEILHPENSKEDLTTGMGLISSTTSNTTSDNSRNHNIRITCEKIDGLVLQPGESFSFNGYVGQRTEEAGYELAGVILNNKSEKDYGGGICQVSTMIYQSVSKADLQIDERHPHQWPSSYCDIGLDATVDWGSADFKFTNTSDYPIAIHAFFDNDAKQVTAQVYGHMFEDGSYIELSSSGSVESSASTTYQADPNLPVGSRNQVTGAHDGKSAISYKTWYDADGNEIKKERYLDSYYPRINAVISVGVRNPDGSLASVDPSTGEVTGAVEETTPESSDNSDVPPPTDSQIAPPPESSETPAPTQPEPIDQPAPPENNESPEQ
ncbi:MAG: VanW family protein [Clostridiales bacterium]|nr:VanW family protein [Clostridiales bacterium]